MTDGVRNIKSWTPKVTRKVRSLYLVVMDVMSKPNPNPRHPVIKIKTGNKSKCGNGWISAPFIKRKKKNKIINREN